MRRQPQAEHNFVSLGVRLRPDIALLAVMEVGSGPNEKTEEAKNQLAAVGFKFELLTPSNYMPEDIYIF
jgi:hypothetical protein